MYHLVVYSLHMKANRECVQQWELEGKMQEKRSCRKFLNDLKIDISVVDVSDKLALY